jgi:Zn finger protein HypA/HybF involved in hydrogenase expression
MLQTHANTIQAEEETNDFEMQTELKEIEHEIECPRCHDIMTLSSSEFDKLGYFCKECSFSLYLN